MIVFKRTDVDRVICNTDEYKGLYVGDIVYIKQILRNHIKIFGKFGQLKKECFTTLDDKPLPIENGHSWRYIAYEDVKVGLIVKSTLDIDSFIKKDKVYRVISHKRFRRGFEEYYSFYLQDIRTGYTHHSRGYHYSSFMHLLKNEIREQKILDFISE